MDTPIAPFARRRLPVRSTCLAATMLCLLAALAGAVVHVDDLGHHHRHVVVATVAGADNHALGARGLLDIATPRGSGADDEPTIAHNAATAAAIPAGRSAHQVRTRGPPATAL